MLSKQQSLEGNLLLKKLCNSSILITEEEACKVFESESDFHYVINILLNKRLICTEIPMSNELQGLHYSKTGLSCGFLKNGGLIKEYKDFKKQEKREKIEFELAESNIKANKLNEKNSRFNKRVNIVNIIIGVVNILVALGLGWWSYKAGLLK